MSAPITNIRHRAEKYDPNSGNDGSLSKQEFMDMKVILQGAQPMLDYDEKGIFHRKYLLRRMGSVVADGDTVKDCYYRYRGWKQ